MIIPSDYACNDFVIHFARDGGSLWRSAYYFSDILMAVAISCVTPAVVHPPYWFRYCSMQVYSFFPNSLVSPLHLPLPANLVAVFALMLARSFAGLFLLSCAAGARWLLAEMLLLLGSRRRGGSELAPICYWWTAGIFSVIATKSLRYSGVTAV